MYKCYQEYLILLKERLPSICQYLTYSHQMKPSLGREGISMKSAVPLNDSWQSTTLPQRLFKSVPWGQKFTQAKGIINKKSMRHGHPPNSTPSQHLSRSLKRYLTENEASHKLFKSHLSFLFATENHDPITKLSRIIQKHKLGKCVSWSNLPKERDKRCKSHLTLDIPPFPSTLCPPQR